jgi:hypothetical protein
MNPPSLGERNNKMKTAEEWMKEFGGTIYAKQAIAIIQLDAFKAGEKFAAEIARANIATGTIAQKYQIEQAILTDAEARTEWVE